MINFGIVKLGDKLGGQRNERGKIEDVTGKLEWNSNVPSTEMLDAGGSGSTILDSLDSPQDWRDQLFNNQFRPSRPSHVERRMMQRERRG